MADLSDYTHTLDGFETWVDEPTYRRRRHVYNHGQNVGSLALKPIVVDVRHLDWQSEAACLGTDPESFFPQGPVPQQTLAICQNCPVYSQCLQHALDHPALRGIWAGTTEAQRKKLRKRRRDAARLAGE